VRCLFDPTPAEFLERTSAFRAANPILTNTLTTAALVRSALRTPAEPGARWIRAVSTGGDVTGIAILTPPRGLLLSPMAHATAALIADAVADLDVRSSGAEGPIDVATSFAERYCSRTGATFATDLDLRMLALRHVTRPRAVSGACRPSTLADRDTVIDWITDFNAEAMPGHEPPPAAHVEKRLTLPETIWIWDVGGRPTSLCWQSVNAAGIVRISAVYTPPGERGHGYASANVASVSQRALDLGASACVLFTDRTNPTSNKVYEAIGYDWVADCMAYAFTPASGSPGSAAAS
jgi:uncharacterized protein